MTFHSDFDFADLEGLEGPKVDNIKPQKIVSSSSWSFLPKGLDEKVAKWHFSFTRSRVLTILTLEQADYIGVKFDVPFKSSRFVRWCTTCYFNIVTLDRMKKKKYNPTVGNIGHVDVKIDLARLGAWKA